MLQDTSHDGLRDRTARAEMHSRAMAERMMQLEAIIARALHEHSTGDKVCACEICAILRTPFPSPVRPTAE